jgi:hypothetical protein
MGGHIRELTQRALRRRCLPEPGTVVNYTRRLQFPKARATCPGGGIRRGYVLPLYRLAEAACEFLEDDQDL